MAKSVYLMAGVYANEERGTTILETLHQMHAAGRVTLIDAALLTKDEQGKLHVKETDELTARKGARRGAVILGVVGLIYPPSLIATVIAGGGIGALAGKIRDTGIKSKQMRELADRISGDQAAVLALSEAESVQKIEATLKGYEGELITEELGTELTAELQAVAEEQSTEA